MVVPYYYADGRTSMDEPPALHNAFVPLLRHKMGFCGAGDLVAPGNQEDPTQELHSFSIIRIAAREACHL